MSTSQVLREGMVNSKHSERTRSHKQQHRQKQPAFRQHKDEESQRRQHSAAKESGAPRVEDRHAPSIQPQGEGAGAEHAKIRCNIKDRREIQYFLFSKAFS